jgi:hypothetical protein
MKKKIALVCMAKNEDYYLQEWIDYHLKLGFDGIHIFQNNWRFQNKIENENVFFHEYDGITELNNEPLWVRNIQARCYTEFSQNYHNEYEWAAFFDVDEFLVLNKHNNVNDFISDYDGFNCLIVNWAMFGDNNLKDFDPNNCSVIERFIMRASSINHQFKSLCKLYPEMKHQIHWTIGPWIDTNFNSGNYGYNYSGNYEIAQLNHYFTKTLPEFILKIERGNACRGGVDGKRDVSDFYNNNFNEVEDLKAIHFYKNNLHIK